MSPNELFLIYVRTLQFMKLRLRGLDESEGVFISQNEIDSRFFPFPAYNRWQELQKLVQSGQLLISKIINPVSGHPMFLYEVLQPGAMDIKLIKPKVAIYDADTLQMISHLKQISVDPGSPELPLYFQAFLKFKEKCINLFVTVDDFAGRVHTPVSNLHRPIRPFLLLDGQPTIGLDVTTMQPLLLGKLLKQAIGPNEYSAWIDSGVDIYSMLQQKANLETRDQGKKRFFEILFAPANNKLAAMFGDAAWITWINQYKSQSEPRNPHNASKPYSNVAWLLQSTEVNVMHKVWHNLINAGIPFLSVHDEVIVKQSDQQKAESIFRSVLDHEFTFYKLNIKCKRESPVQFIPPPPPPDIRHVYIGPDGLLYIYVPGLPDLT